MMRLLEYTVLPLVWGGLLLAVLSTYEAQGFAEHSVCGPWGCGPPTNTLVAIHGAWAIVLWPPLFYLPWRLHLSRKTIKIASTVLMTVGLMGMLGIATWQWTVWLPNASAWARDYIWQRCGFVIVTASDWPLLQLFFAGGLLKIIPWFIQLIQKPVDEKKEDWSHESASLQ